MFQLPTFHSRRFDSVRQPNASGQRLAMRLAALQLIVAVLTALPWWVRGWREALAAFMGGAIVALGTWLMGRSAFAGAEVSAARAMSGLLLGTAARWVAIAIGLVLALRGLHSPPIPLICGLMVALMVQLFGMRLTVRAER